MAGGPVLVGLRPAPRRRRLSAPGGDLRPRRPDDIECEGHRVAFNAAFAAHGLDLEWSVARYRKLLALSDERQRSRPN